MTQIFLARDKVDGKRFAVFFENTLGIHLVARFRKEGTGAVGVKGIEWSRRVLVVFPQVRVVAVQQEVLAEHILFVHGFAIQ